MLWIGETYQIEENVDISPLVETPPASNETSMNDPLEMASLYALRTLGGSGLLRLVASTSGAL